MDEDSIIYLVRSSHAISYMYVSAGTLMVYDTLLVFPREVTHIWSAKWSGPKVLYILSRYWGLAILFVDLAVYTQLQTSVPWCRRFLWYNMTIGSTATLSLMVNIILIMRLHALYGRSTKVLIFLILVLIADFALATVSVVYVGPLAHATMFVAPAALPLLGCVSAPDLSMTIYSWLGGVATAIIFFLMMAVKLFRNNRATPRHSHTKVPPLVYAFYRDGTMTFFLIMCMTIIGFILCFSVEGPLQISYMPWITVVTSACGSRLILHLREAAYDEPNRINTDDDSRLINGPNFYNMQSVRFNKVNRTDQTSAPTIRRSMAREPISVSVEKEVHVVTPN